MALSWTRPRPRTLRRARAEAGFARVDRRTKNLIGRLRPGEVAVIDHEDLDRVAAEGLVSAGVSAVVNAAPSITGRYPNMGPLILADAGVPLIDHVGHVLLDKVNDGDGVHLDGDRVFVGDVLVGVGVRQTRQSVHRDMELAREAMGERFERFARNTVTYMQEERDLLFGGAGLPDLRQDLEGRPVLVVVRGYGYREDLAALRAYIHEQHPVLLGVDGGADALLDEGYVPDIILGDMDSVSDRALQLALGRDRRRRRKTELVLHAYQDGRAPGRDRLKQLGVPFRTVRSVGTSEDVAFLLAHEKRADLIVAVGTHGNLQEFLDKGRDGMSSTFLVRLRVGEILMDAKGVSRLYPSRTHLVDTLLLIGSAIVVLVIMVAASSALRLFVKQTYTDILDWARALL